MNETQVRHEPKHFLSLFQRFLLAQIESYVSEEASYEIGANKLSIRFCLLFI